MGSLLKNRKVRNALLQMLYVGTLGTLLLTGVLIARRNLAAQGITSGLDFLFKSTGWDVSFSLLPVTATDPYWWFFVIGIVNTLFLGAVGLVLATILGTIVGLARTSSNELANLLGRTYVDIFRNIPLILQVFFWFAVITHLPAPRNAHEAWGFVLSSRGLYVPAPNVAGPALAGAAMAVLAAIALPIWIGRTSRLRQPVSERLSMQLAAAAAALACAVVALLLGRLPDLPFLDLPMLQGLNLRGGLRISPEFTALAVAKIERLAGEEEIRGRGVGSALLKHGTSIYLQLGYLLLYGQLVTGRGLESYYASRGFTVLDPNEWIPLDVILGYPASVGPDQADQRVFARWR